MEKATFSIKDFDSFHIEDTHCVLRQHKESKKWYVYATFRFLEDAYRYIASDMQAFNYPRGKYQIKEMITIGVIKKL